MAFSYSDKNFTVIGNLCFVHIAVDSASAVYKISPAISDRMLDDNIIFGYVSYDNLDGNYSIGYLIIFKDRITCTALYDKGYLMAYFPIDSNK